jgi:hypothetical protein
LSWKCHPILGFLPDPKKHASLLNLFSAVTFEFREFKRSTFVVVLGYSQTFTSFITSPTLLLGAGINQKNKKTLERSLFLKNHNILLLKFESFTFQTFWLCNQNSFGRLYYSKYLQLCSVFCAVEVRYLGVSSKRNSFSQQTCIFIALFATENCAGPALAAIKYETFFFLRFLFPSV